MKRTTLTLAALALCAANIPFAFSADKAGDKVIYGADDRLDVYQVTDAKLLKLADSTVVKLGDVEELLLSKTISTVASCK